jgi:aryl-alcohol dehydrogenase-like predicted oxidoreductase
MKALHDLVQTGKVRYIGASSMWAWEFAHYNNVAEVGLSPLGGGPHSHAIIRNTAGRSSCLCRIVTTSSIVRPQCASPYQALISNMWSGEEEREMNKYCDFAGIGLIPYSALGFGKLARPLGNDATKRAQVQGRVMPWYAKPEEAENEIRRRVEKVAKDKGWTMGQVALAWIGGRVTSPLVGVTSVSHC